MEHEITVRLTEDEYNTLSEEAKQTGKEIEALMHELLAMQLRLPRKSRRLEETDEEYEEREWEKLLSSPQGQRTLDHLLAEARHQIAAGEFEEGGFGLEALIHELFAELHAHQQLRSPKKSWRTPEQQEISEILYKAGLTDHVPTGEPLTEEEEAELNRIGNLLAGGKPASEMVIEDRGPY